MTEELNGIGLLVALPVGIFVYFFRRWWDRNRMRQSMARILHTELSVNAEILTTYMLNGMDYGLPVFNDVYKGLLTSGNIQYLSAYQHRLYSLYSSLRHDDKSKTKLLNAMLDDLNAIIICPFETLCSLNPIHSIKRVTSALRLKAKRRK